MYRDSAESYCYWTSALFRVLFAELQIIFLDEQNHW